MVKMLSLYRSVMVALMTIASSSIIVNGFKSAMAPTRKSFLQMGPINAIKSLLKGPTIPAGLTYDYIIVGGGTAGCVLANRLSENSGKRVLVLEAGSKDFKNKHIQIPAGILKLFKSKFDWDFDASPEPNVNNRSIYLCRGKVLGGSSCANVLLYHRGDSNDYKDWADMTGDNEWGPENVLPYFKKSEDDFRGESKFHGAGGEFAVSDVRYQNPLSKTFLMACGESGFQANDDFNNWSRSQEGYGRYQVSEKDGSRCSAASGFLEPIMSRKNLNVVTRATVSKITFTGTKATGVDVIINGEEHHVSLSEGGEVLLTGGAISSPQILMLSGVGPQEHLTAHGIEVVHDMQGVGRNLQDHPATVVSYECSKGNEGVSVTSVIRIPGTTINNPKVVLDWVLNKSGPLTSTGCDHGAFFKTKEELVSPDLQMRFLAARAITADGMGTFTKFRESSSLGDGFSFQSIVSRPLSAGSVELKSNDPFDKPFIRTGYFTDECSADLATMREGIKLSRKLASSESFAKYKGEEVFPGSHIQTDEELDLYIRNSAHTSNALVGTCKMGVRADPMSVVATDLRVHGLTGIRIADSSVMPKIPGGQTGAPTVMIAEKAADIIIQSARTHQEGAEALSVVTTLSDSATQTPSEALEQAEQAQAETVAETLEELTVVDISVSALAGAGIAPQAA